MIFRQWLLRLSNLQKPVEWHAMVEFGVTVGVVCGSRVSMCAGYTGEIDAMSIYTHTKTRITPTQVQFGPTTNSFQAAVGLAVGFLGSRESSV